MIPTNKINFQNVDSDLLAAGIMYFEDYVAGMHKNLIESNFANFDAFSIIEITTTMILQDKTLDNIHNSIKESVPKSPQLTSILNKTKEFHEIIHDNDGKTTLKILKQKSTQNQHNIALIIMFLNHLTINFLRILNKEKTKLTAAEINNTKFTKLLAIIFDQAFEKTLSELKT